MATLWLRHLVSPEVQFVNSTLDVPRKALYTMKNFVRAFALSLVATGAFAATQITPASTTINTSSKAMPIPYCDPMSGTCTLTGNN